MRRSENSGGDEKEEVQEVRSTLPSGGLHEEEQAVLCERWGCSCQGFSEVLDAWPWHWGKAARDVDARTWWIDHACDTSPVARRPMSPPSPPSPKPDCMRPRSEMHEKTWASLHNAKVRAHAHTRAHSHTHARALTHTRSLTHTHAHSHTHARAFTHTHTHTSAYHPLQSNALHWSCARVDGWGGGWCASTARTLFLQTREVSLLGEKLTVKYLQNGGKDTWINLLVGEFNSDQ